jgi:hypothetical protein
MLRFSRRRSSQFNFSGEPQLVKGSVVQFLDADRFNWGFNRILAARRAGYIL